MGEFLFFIERQKLTKKVMVSAKLWSIDLTGYNERMVKTPTDGSDPSWSSLLTN